MKGDVVREFFLGFVAIHILHHAERGGFYGSWMMAELSRHGYRLGPGTLYPTLHTLEQHGYLRREAKVEGGRRRIYYVITPSGSRLLRTARKRVGELVSEVEKTRGHPAAEAVEP